MVYSEGNTAFIASVILERKIGIKVRDKTPARKFHCEFPRTHDPVEQRADFLREVKFASFISLYEIRNLETCSDQQQEIFKNLYF